MFTVFVSIATLLVLLGLIVVRYKSSRSLLEPGIIFAINLILLYPIRAIALLVFGDDALPDFPGAAEPDNIELAISIAFFGCFGYVIGYFLVMKTDRLEVLDGKLQAQGNQLDFFALTAFWLLSLLGVGYKIATGDYISYLIGEERNSAFTQLSHLLSMFQWPAYIGALALWFQGRRDQKFILLFVGVMVTVIPYQFLQGSKTFLSLLIVSGIIAYYWVFRKLPKFNVLIGVWIIIVFVFPFVTGFREYVNNEFGRIPSFGEIEFSRVGDYSEKDSRLRGKDENPIFKFSARYGGIDHLYGITETVPSLMDYRFGFAYSAVLVNIIPRAVWPDKPIYSRGADYGSSLGTSTSVTPFPIGEAYWDLGEYGVIFMMALWGAALAAVTKGYNRFFVRGQSFMIAMFFLSQIYWISGGETSMPMVLSGLPQQIFMLWGVYWIVNILSKRTK